MKDCVEMCSLVTHYCLWRRALRGAASLRLELLREDVRMNPKVLGLGLGLVVGGEGEGGPSSASAAAAVAPEL